MNKLWLIIFVLFSYNNVYAWELVDIKSRAAETVGYIYHTSAIGTKYSPGPSKAITGMRLICSTKGGSPIISIFWKSNLGNTDLTVITTIDKTIITNIWKQDDQLIYRDIKESDEIMLALKSAKIVKFQWADIKMNQHITAFNFSDADFSEFYSKCKI